MQFAGVEQQINMNQQLTSLVTLQKANQVTSAMSFLGATATVDGSSTKLASGKATWTFAVDKPSNGTITIKDANGQTAYSGAFPLNAGTQAFSWDGRGTNGNKWPDGAYTLSITAKDASGQSVAVSTTVNGTVDAVDLSPESADAHHRRTGLQPRQDQAGCPAGPVSPRRGGRFRYPSTWATVGICFLFKSRA